MRGYRSSVSALVSEGTHGESLRDRITADFNHLHYTKCRDIKQAVTDTNCTEYLIP